jgi:hypothetical protein
MTSLAVAKVRWWYCEVCSGWRVEVVVGCAAAVMSADAAGSGGVAAAAAPGAQVCEAAVDVGDWRVALELEEEGEARVLGEVLGGGEVVG